MKREWWPGTYRVVDTVKGYVGQVYVTGTGGVSTVEHYVLLESFANPDGVHASTIEKTTQQYTSLNEFLTAMQLEVTASGAKAKYVKAICTYQTMHP